MQVEFLRGACRLKNVLVINALNADFYRLLTKADRGVEIALEVTVVEQQGVANNERVDPSGRPSPAVNNRGQI